MANWRNGIGWNMMELKRNIPLMEKVKFTYLLV